MNDDADKVYLNSINQILFSILFFQSATLVIEIKKRLFGDPAGQLNKARIRKQSTIKYDSL